MMSSIANSSRKDLMLYGGAVLLAVAMGAVLVYVQRFLGDAGPYIVLGAILAAILFGVILLDWRRGTLLLAAILPFQSVINVGPVASGTKALAVVTFFALGLALLREPRLFDRFARLWRQPLTLAVFVFVLWAFVSITWAPYQEAALSRTSTFVGVFGLMVVVGMLESRYLTYLWAVTALSVLVSVPAAYVLPQGEDMLEAGRFGTGGADPNSYACLLVITLLVAYFGLPQYRTFVYILAPILLYGIFATQSRTGLLALIAAPMLAMFVPRLAARLGGRALLMYSLVFAALAVIVVAIPSVGDDVLERYTSLSRYQDETTWSGRWSIWQAAFQIIASHPFLGVGAGNFPYTALNLSTVVAAHTAEKGEAAGVVHNMFLSVASELGFIGLTIFLVVLYLAFRTVMRISRGSLLGTGVFVGLIVFTIAGMSLTWEYEKVGYVLLGSILALQLQAERGVDPPAGQEYPR
jgi:O-antigen ligase